MTPVLVAALTVVLLLVWSSWHDQRTAHRRACCSCDEPALGVDGAQFIDRSQRLLCAACLRTTRPMKEKA